MKPLPIPLEVAIALGIASAVALAFNALRPSGLPLVAPRPYAILVPCSEKQGAVTVVAPDDPRITAPGSVVVDGREAEAHAAWHLPGARNVPYDYLDPVEAEDVSRLIASGARWVVVYGDGADPDSGQELAKEIAGRGVGNVLVVRGGAPALQSNGGER